MNRAVRILAAASVLGACTDDGPHRRRPDPNTSTETTPTVRGPRGAGITSQEARAYLVERGVQRCADPSLRSIDPWIHLEGPTLPVSAPQTWGGGLVVGDFRGTGRLDAVLLGEGGSQYFLTEPGSEPGVPVFTDVIDAAGDLAALDWNVGGAAADLDGDGWTDLILARWDAPNAILLNDGSGGFVDATPPELLAHAYKTQSVTVGDMDGDGDLDLFFGNYGDRPPALQDPRMPPGEPSELYRNDGGGWTELSDRLPDPVQDGYTFMSALYDLDGDRLPELFVFHDFSFIRPSQLGTNLGDFQWEFRDEWHGGGKMGVATTEINGDGVPDFFMTSYQENFALASGEALGLPGAWINSTEAWGLTPELDTRNQDFGWGADFGDVDNDGDDDLLATYGYWEDWPSLSRPVEYDALYEQTGPSEFVDRGAEWGLDDSGAGRGVLLADLNRDGWLDVVKRQLGAETILKIARCGETSWARVLLEAPAPNTQGIGATVRLTADGTTRTRWIQSGATSMYAGAAPEAHFGLGEAERIERLEILWPDGQLSRFEDIAVNQELRVVRYSSSPSM